VALTNELRKSTRSNTSGDCVECGFADQAGAAVLIRDSKDPDGPRLVVSRQAFAGLLNWVKAGQL
jgi:hypothetical protein